jgi:putative ABC transport system permease protein
MILKANMKEALRSLLSAKQRTLLALIGIVIGIGSVIGMVSVGAIVENESLKRFKDMGVDIVSVTRESGSDGGKPEGFNVRDVLELTRASGAVVEVAPFASSSAQIGPEESRKYLELYGVTSSFFDLNKLSARAGRLISDLDKDRYFCVIGPDLEDALRKSGHPDVLGRQFLFGRRVYTVIGVLNSTTEGGMKPSGINSSVITHISTAMKAFENGNVGKFLARTGGHGSAAAKPVIEAYFKKKERGARVSITTAEELVAQMAKEMRLFTLLLGAIGSISLLVGGVGVMNVMLISVTERRKEIGIRRALGAHQGDILAQFIIESMALCFVGGIIGIVLGMAVSYGFAHVSKYGFLVSYGSIFLGFGVSMSVGVFFGYYPARQAARSDPIAALRS